MVAAAAAVVVIAAAATFAQPKLAYLICAWDKNWRLRAAAAAAAAAAAGRATAVTPTTPLVRQAHCLREKPAGRSRALKGQKDSFANQFVIIWPIILARFAPAGPQKGPLGFGASGGCKGGEPAPLSGERANWGPINQASYQASKQARRQRQQQVSAPGCIEAGARTLLPRRRAQYGKWCWRQLDWLPLVRRTLPG